MKNLFKNKVLLCVIIKLFLVKIAVAQFDIRLTSAYGKMYLIPETDLNVDINYDKFLTAGIQIDYNLTKKFGIGIGADYYVRRNTFDIILSDYSNQYSSSDNWEVDPFPRDYQFAIRSNSTDIVEQNTMSFAEIPVSALYSFPIFANSYFVTRLGLKIGFPLEKDYVLKSSDLYTRLYFEEWDLELFNIPAHGLYDSRTDWNPEGQIRLNNPVSLFCEIGVDFPISRSKVRMSGYISNGLNNVIEEQQSSLIYWREEYNNILSLTESTNIFQYGIKLGIGIITKKEMKTKYKNRIICAWEY